MLSEPRVWARALSAFGIRGSPDSLSKMYIRVRQCSEWLIVFAFSWFPVGVGHNGRICLSSNVKRYHAGELDPAELHVHRQGRLHDGQADPDVDPARLQRC